MKQKRSLSYIGVGLGIGIGITAIIILWLGIRFTNAMGQFGHAEIPRGFGRGHEFGHRGGGFGMKPHPGGMGWIGMSAIAMTLMKLSLLGVFAVIWAKAAGILKWAGAVLTALTLMSLLTPFWGLVVVILLFLAQGRIKRMKETYGSPHAGVMDYPMTEMNIQTPIASSYERGRMLDEWEKRNYKEENK